MSWGLGLGPLNIHLLYLGLITNEAQDVLGRDLLMCLLLGLITNEAVALSYTSLLKFH